MLLAVLPATPVQLAHACYQLGYDVVVPASWGDELVAHAVLDELSQRDRAPVIQCTCPLAHERLLASGGHLERSLVLTAAPPVAAARYARRAFAPQSLHITYIGACPGAADAAIDVQLLPDEFLGTLAERDIALSDMPTVYDSVLPPDRRRHFSLPGGCPSQEALWEKADGRMLREVAPATFATDLAQTLVWHEHVMVDVAPALGCPCAGGLGRLGARHGRISVMAVEPPRATAPVIAHQPDLTQPSPPAVAPARNGRSSGPRRPAEAATGNDDRANSSPGEASAAAHISASAGRAVRRVTPARASALLPRAYLAKRRRVGVGQDLASERGEPDAESGGPVPQTAVEPNEADERARPIALHVEPGIEVADFDDAAVPEVPSTAADWLGTDKADSVHQVVSAPASFAPPIPHVAPQEPEPEAGSDTPLRVEVEIFEEETVLASEPERQDVRDERAPAGDVVLDAGPATDSLRRRWGDLLIAVWLLLVASAVLATLLWRR